MTDATADAAHTTGPLRGLKVLELGHFIAGPFCTRLLADLGAEVVKVEPPRAGDPVRSWGNMVDGRSLWWSCHGRNKKCVTLDLRHARAKPILDKLVGWADVIVENFRPGMMERIGLGFPAIQAINPRCILMRISGFGQDGPYRDKVAFGVVGEAMGGIRYLTAHPDRPELPSVRVGVSIGDSISGLYAMAGVLAAVYERDVAGTGRGREVDVALYESVFSMLEGSLTEYGALGVVRQPSGSGVPTAAPTDAWRCKDGAWLCIGANSDNLFARLCKVLGQPELAADSRFRDNPARLANVKELNALIGEWAATQTAAEAERILDAAEVPVSRIYTIADIAADPHYRARGMVQAVDDPAFGTVLHPGVVPRFDDRGPQGGIAWTGPAVGAHNAEVYGALLGADAAALHSLAQEGVI
ncbi:MAG: CaiB/BaiF CoA transferase family protein [Rhodospirillales bacterium]